MMVQAMVRTLASVLLVVLVFIIQQSQAVDRSKFRTCKTTGFCSAYLKTAGPQVIDPALALTLSDDGGKLVSGDNLSSECLLTGAIRVRIAKQKRWEYDQVLVDTARQPFKPYDKSMFKCGEDTLVKFADGKLSFFRATTPSKPFLVLNDKGMTYFEFTEVLPASSGNDEQQVAEQRRQLEESSKKDGRKIIDWGEDGKPIYEGGEHGSGSDQQAAAAAAAEQATNTNSPTVSRAAAESFGGFTDEKPKGPSSVGFDATFYDTAEDPAFVSLHGLPEHAAAFSLKDTDGSSGGAFSEPYRLYNLDVFEYELDEPMALYGSVPYILARDSKNRFSGLFLNNPSETFVDVSTTTGSRSTRWISESGVLDLFVYSGGVDGKMEKVLNQHTTLTGKPYLPPMFALAYHQCRWNYRDQKDVEEVHAKFEELDFPFDVLWLDIEHTDGKRYFTWDSTKFPDPIKMQDDLKRTGRRMVTIVDPHVKRDPNYFVHSEAEKLGHYLKDGTADFDGWCWPGSSSYPDFTNGKVRQWWGDFYSRYDGSTDRLSTWIDMNEMSVFNGPEVTMKKTGTNIDGIEHREWHNIYGMSYHQATFEGIKKARKGQRPFILTRSFFAGTQRFGAIWNGDNKADWSHLKVTAPMLLSMSVAGLHFVGADVGGFFGNPEPELLVRWYESGAFQPFFRAHAHIETKRREPWLFGEETLRQIRSVVMERYRILPYLYTAFEEASRTGMPVMRPVFGAFSSQAMEDAWLLGADLFVYPILTPGETKLYVHDIPSEGEFIEFDTGKQVLRGATFDAPLGRTPVFQRIGSIVPKQMRLRRSSELMFKDPYTLQIAVDEKGQAQGTLYVDDQVTFDHSSKNAKAQIKFSLSGCADDSASSKCELRGVMDGKFDLPNKIERIQFVGGSKKRLGCKSNSGNPEGGVAEQEGKQWRFDIECEGSSVVWRKPWVDAGKNFEIRISV